MVIPHLLSSDNQTTLPIGEIQESDDELLISQAEGTQILEGGDQRSPMTRMTLLG